MGEDKWFPHGLPRVHRRACPEFIEGPFFMVLHTTNEQNFAFGDTFPGAVVVQHPPLPFFVLFAFFVVQPPL